MLIKEQDDSISVTLTIHLFTFVTALTLHFTVLALLFIIRAISLSTMSVPTHGHRPTFRNRGLVGTGPTYQQLADDSNILMADNTSTGSPETALPKRSDFATIDWIRDLARERQRKLQLLSVGGLRGGIWRWMDATQAWFLVAGVGLSAGLLVGALDVSAEWLSDMRFGYCKTGFYLNQRFCCWQLSANEPCTQWMSWSSAIGITSETTAYWVAYAVYLTVAGMLAALAAYLVDVYAPFAAGSGLAEIKTILTGYIIRTFLGARVLFIKSIAVVLTVASGLSVGKESPFVHVACAIGNVLSRFSSKYATNEAKKREILSAAAAAGISVAFGAPIGGVLFSLEKVSYYFPYKTMWRSFFCAMFAAVALKVVDPFRTGKLVLFQVSYDKVWHNFEMIFFCLLGALGGLLGAFFNRMSLFLISVREHLSLRGLAISETVIVALVTAIISFLNIFMRVDTAELVSYLFQECSVGDFQGLCDQTEVGSIAGLLILAGLAKIFLTILAVGLPIPSGVYMPSMAIGACFGRALGMLVQAWQRNYPGAFFFSSCPPDVSCITPGTYALVGAAAVLGGVTRMTVSLAVIMFELTGALTYVLPIMVAVMISKWVGDAFGEGGLDDAIIRLKGYPYLDDSNNEDLHSDRPVERVMTRMEDMVVLFERGHVISEIEDLLESTEYNGFPIVKSIQDMKLVGYIIREDLKTALEQSCVFVDEPSTAECINFYPWINETPLTVKPTFPMSSVVDMFTKMGLRFVLVIEQGRLLGLVTKKDVMTHVYTQRATMLLQ
ncbi:chloride channel [Syncephalis fuscata]|nr:chloride channel [Syncephalis fuscata]